MGIETSTAAGGGLALRVLPGGGAAFSDGGVGFRVMTDEGRLLMANLGAEPQVVGGQLSVMTLGGRP